MDTGILYVAIGQKYIREATYSARSLKKWNPNLHTTIICDQHLDGRPFDDVDVRPNIEHRYGVISPDLLPYQRTLFLDTDTYICAEINDLFPLLDTFDLALTHSPGRPDMDKRHSDVINEDIPITFPLYNTGVILIDDNPSSRAFLKKWGELYEKYIGIDRMEFNQPTFRAALYLSDVNTITIHQEYNYRIPYAGSAIGEVKILHGRVGEDVRNNETIANKLNETDVRRVHVRNSYPIEVIVDKPGRIYRLKRSLSGNGVMSTVKTITQRLGDRT